MSGAMKEKPSKSGRAFVTKGRSVSRLAFLSTAFLLSPILKQAASVQASETRPAWQVEWERTVKAAEKEGKSTFTRWATIIM